MLNSIEKIIYLSLFLPFLIVRKYYTWKFRKTNLKKNRLKLLDIILLSLSGTGMTIPLFYVFSDILDFANFTKPFWLNIPGIVIMTGAILCLWFSHHDLGSNWSPTLGIKKDHKLVKNGIYKYIRHPMYSAHILWALGQTLILPNWIAGFSFIIFVIPFLLLRIKDEEAMMIEHFGEEYKNYIKTTGAVLPKIKVQI